MPGAAGPGAAAVLLNRGLLAVCRGLLAVLLNGRLLAVCRGLLDRGLLDRGLLGVGVAHWWDAVGCLP
jgi:hypothetical protein